ncbi:protein geranylgeranyltransferase [Pseudoscourfieldia marina]
MASMSEAWAHDYSDLSPGSTSSMSPPPVVCIAHAPAVRKTQMILHALIRKQEYSARTVAITANALRNNPADYTAFAVRRLCLTQARDTHVSNLARMLEEEFAFTGDFVEMFPKNYQLWGHRRWLADTFAISDSNGKSEEDTQQCLLDEMAFAHVAIEDDNKNYHAWSHRAYFLQKAANVLPSAAADRMFQAEMAYTARLLDVDNSNNSAWNARHLAVTLLFESATTSHDTDEAQARVDAAMASETAFALARLEVDPSNEAVWSYITDLVAPADDELARVPWRAHAAHAAAAAAATLDALASALVNKEDGKTAANALEYRLHRACQASSRAENAENAREACEDARAACKSLERVDGAMRAGLWRFRRECI